jgi:hypothetical protein
MLSYTKIERERLSFEQKKQLFYENQTINPDTGRTIQIGKDTYNKLVDKYGNPQTLPYDIKKNTLNYNVVDDVLPQIFEHLPVTTARLINKQSLAANLKYKKREYIITQDQKLHVGDYILYNGSITYHNDIYGFILKLTKQYVYIMPLDNYEFYDVDIRPNVNIKISTKEMKYIKRIELSEEYLNNMNFMTKHYIKSFNI